MTTVTPVSLHIVIHTCKPKRECGVKFGKGRYINHHVLYLDEGAKETWETFIIISSRHQEDREYGEGDAVPNAQNAECRMRLRCLRQVCMVKWMRKVWHVHGIWGVWDSGPGYCLVVCTNGGVVMLVLE